MGKWENAYFHKQLVNIDKEVFDRVLVLDIIDQKQKFYAFLYSKLRKRLPPLISTCSGREGVNKELPSLIDRFQKP